ncbi:hypothetical protein [Achromobacter sp. NFACC18-2]|uniref:hypothetical protein n=1 Tax=Achromobacter sp. NFACC18-2 TaxID=1564112 RepID=UPI000A92AE9A|nr:hypothetical protein [Achromobacter sp. NFACC18-2]
MPTDLARCFCDTNCRWKIDPADTPSGHCLLISPAFFILGLSHWASLLLCWRPRWPRIIREAGQAGKPVPAFSTVEDYPPDVRAQLLANAHRWALRPGRAPDNRRRGREDAR